MTPDDFLRTEQIFHEALELDEVSRKSFLEGLSSEYGSVVAEVRSLLEAFVSSPKILDETAYDIVAEIANEPEPTLVGEKIGPYEIQRLLGRGGMGDVYLAEDSNLDRPVALKFLSSAFVDNAWAKRQLVREAKAVAGFDHPNICRVFGLEEVGEHRFIVMQFIDGVSLSKLIEEKNVDATRVARMASEIAEAIAEAHRHGVIHRDIKPGNIMLDADGHVKVLDFGLAKFLPSADGTKWNGKHQSNATQPGLIFGTVAYMSPEQLKAEKLDFRSDVFSIGTVLAELVRGSHPFERNSKAETISAILAGGLPPARATGIRHVNPLLERVARRCLEKKKENRYQSAVEVALELCDSREPRRFAWDELFTRGGIGLLIVLVLILVGYFFFSSNHVRSLAVLPYRNETGDSSLNYLADGLAEGLGNKLATFDRLKIKSLAGQVIPAGADVDAMIFGRNSSIDLVLTGSVTKQNGQLSLRVNALDINQGVTIRNWNHPFTLEELPVLEDEIANEIFTELNLGENKTKKSPQHRGAETDNSEAFREYWIGRYYWKQRDEENLKRAVDSFKKSIKLDPGYSRPYSGLADSYVLLSLVAYGSMPTKDAMTMARATALQALEIDPLDAEAHTSLGVVFTKYDWNWAAAENEFKMAIQNGPDYSPAHYWYSSLLAILGRENDAIREAQKAKDLDPLFPQVNINFGRVLYYARRYDEALALLTDRSNEGGKDKKSQYLIGLIYLQKGMYEKAKGTFEAISAENRVLAAAGLGYAYAKLGRRDDALDLIAELKETLKTKYIPPQEFAIIYAGLGERKAAIHYLNESFKERHSALIAAKVEPLFDSLREEKDFGVLLDEMQLK